MPCSTNFELYKSKIRKSGTGEINEINDNLFEGRCSPTNAYGKHKSHRVYADTRAEYEKLLEEMIPNVRLKIKAEEEKLTTKHHAQKQYRSC